MKNNLSMEMQKLVGANTLRGIAYGVLAGALVLTAGCGKKEEEQTNLTLICNDLLSSVNHRKSPQTFI